MIKPSKRKSKGSQNKNLLSLEYMSKVKLIKSDSFSNYVLFIKNYVSKQIKLKYCFVVSNKI